MSFTPFNNRFLRHNSFYTPPPRNFYKKNTPHTKTASDIPKEDSFDKDNKDNSRLENKDFFEVFGVKLYYDDILLISLIFFLYNEGVEDKELFIALILLLLS